MEKLTMDTMSGEVLAVEQLTLTAVVAMATELGIVGGNLVTKVKTGYS
jgi:hypothetical protein